MKKRKALIFCFLYFIGIYIYAQHDNTLYFMDKVPQHHYMNPALNPECDWWLGGLIVPIFGQLPPAMHLDLSTPIDINDVLYQGTGIYSDSLVTPLHPSEDINTFLDKLDETNYVSFEYQLNYLYFGFSKGKNVFTFDLSDRMYFHFGVPGDLFSFILKGNAEERDADIGGFELNTSYYREFAVGYNRELSRYLKLGIRGKFLIGIANISTPVSDLRVQTEEVTNDITAYANYTLQTNLPIESVTYDETGSYITDIAFQEMAFDDTDYLINTFGFPKNFGWAVDLGLSKDWNSELTYYLSVVDLGLINWKQNTSVFSVDDDNEFVYEGVEITSLNTDSIQLMPTIDQLIEDNEIEYKDTSYTTWLPMKIYAGLKYKFTKRLNVGALARFEKLQSKWLQTYTASLNVNMFKWGNLSGSYSYGNDSWTNIGFGYTLRLGPAQWYFVSDNLIGSVLFPYNTRNVNLRFGCNLVFGINKKKKGSPRKVPLVNTL